MALIQGDRNVAHAYLDEGADVAEELDDGALGSHIAHWRALEHLFSGQLDQAVAMYAVAIAEHRRRGDLAAELTAAFQLGMAQTYAGRSEEALVTCREVLQAGAGAGERWTRAYSLWVSGLCHVHLGRPIEAKADVVAALEIQRDFRDGICTALTIELTSWVATSYGHDENAAILSGAARSVWSRLGTTISAFGPHLTAEAQACNTTIDERLGAERARAVRAQHTSVTFGEAIDLALDLAAAAGNPTVPARPRPAHRESAATRNVGRTQGDAGGRSSIRLTKREDEVARLIAQGLSNKAIAQALVISPRTVDGHLERILAKLEFTSRTQVAAWMGSQTAGTASPGMAATTGPDSSRPETRPHRLPVRLQDDPGR